MRGGGRFTIALIAIFILLVAARWLGAAAVLRELLEWIASLGALAPIVFIIAYIVACVLFIPGAIMTISGGAIFGVVRGSIYVSIGATIGATMAFLIGRYFAREWVAAKLAGNRTFSAIDEAVGREGWKIVGLTRLSPLFPFVLLNYAYGLTRVRLRDYVLASWIGMIPGGVMYVYIGSLAGDLAGLGRATTKRPSGFWILNLVGLAATVAVALYAARIARRALAERKLTAVNPAHG
ncbi:MAG: TVP38/TMEM64 family protein [Candidatus Binataceae bacterium]|nr:TVP38/TMEM64 family protein [Candidatus Binataceae bacterium]